MWNRLRSKSRSDDRRAVQLTTQGVDDARGRRVGEDGEQLIPTVPGSSKEASTLELRPAIVKRDLSQDRRDDPLGLVVLHSPTQRRSADIVFIHGLGGSSLHTWCKNGDAELFWPQKWLPKEPTISTARILTFGYNARYASKPGSITGISDFAKDLLFHMRFGKDDLMQDLGIGIAPIIFVTHSMGGLIFKQAYIQALNCSDYRHLAEQFRAVLFLSTPHRGSNLAETLNRILAVSVFGHSPKQYIADLYKNSHFIEDINENFRHHASNLSIFSFYETLQISVGLKTLMVLEKESSILGYPGEISKPLDANHNNVCKFIHPQDLNYRSICAVLKTIVTGLLDDNKLEIQNERQNVSNLLGIHDVPEEDHSLFRSHRKLGTCEHIMSIPEFIAWRTQSAAPKILWIHAGPGSGKSVLCSYLIDHLIETGKICAYFYFRFGNPSKRSPSAMLMSIAFQVSKWLAPFRRALSNMQSDGMKVEKTEPKRIWQKLFFSLLFQQQSSQPVYWVLDALDESDDISTTLQLISSIPTSKLPIHILVVSRYTPLISKAFERMSISMTVYSVCTDSNVDDIRLYTISELEFFHGSKDDKRRIVDQIVSRSQGNFLWVNFVLKEVMQCHLTGDIEQALQEIPDGMESMYERMEAAVTRLKKPSEKKLAKSILTWATYSRRPLTMKELSMALESESPAILDLRYTINQVCGHFVVVNNDDSVSLVHQTARDYLVNSAKLEFSLASNLANEDLFVQTISLYLDQKTRSLLAGPAMPTFYTYAGMYWAHHLSLSDPSSNIILDLLVRFFQPPFITHWIQVLASGRTLETLVYTSKSLASFVHRRRKADVSRSPLLHRITDLGILDQWAHDLLKIVGKFGNHILQEPSCIYNVVPSLCPQNSLIYQQFGTSAASSVSVRGLTNMEWDDCLARVSVGGGMQATSVICAGRLFAISTNVGHIQILDALTFQERRKLPHEEHIFAMCFNDAADVLVSYGLKTTKIWNVSDGHIRHTVPNPCDSRALGMSFSSTGNSMWIGTDLRGVKTLSLERPTNGWQDLDPHFSLDDAVLEGAFSNSPTGMAFSPDFTQLAVAYRGFPLSVWSLTHRRLSNRCKRRTEQGKIIGKSWAGVTRVTWHPFNGETLGIYTDGGVFRWHPVDESYQELKGEGASPSEVQCSPNGLLFATSDVNGSVKLYNFQYFALVYRLSSEDIVCSICFSPDSRRFYDVRGHCCNIWEPNVLIRSVDSDERATDLELEVGSSTLSINTSESWADSRPPITALSGRLRGELLVYGNDEGLVEMYDIKNDKKQEIAPSAACLSIDHLAWGEDEGRFAYVAPGSRLMVKEVTALIVNGKFQRWLCRTTGNVKLSSDHRVQQILISPKSDRLLAASQDHSQLFSLPTCSQKSIIKAGDSKAILKWSIDPQRNDRVLLVSVTTVTSFNWSNLAMIGSWKFQSQKMAQTSKSNVHLQPKGMAPEQGSPLPEVEEVISIAGESFLTVTLLHVEGATAVRERLLIDMSSLPTSSGNNAAEAPVIEHVQVPERIANLIARALGVLRNNRIAFIDHSLWVCTWRFRNSEGEAGVRRHFFLPRDWVNADSLKLCQLLADGTVLCPRLGEVAVIRSNLGSEF